jgi:hypothetical protein
MRASLSASGRKRGSARGGRQDVAPASILPTRIMSDNDSSGDMDISDEEYMREQDEDVEGEEDEEVNVDMEDDDDDDQAEVRDPSPDFTGQSCLLLCSCHLGCGGRADSRSRASESRAQQAENQAKASKSHYAAGDTNATRSAFDIISNHFFPDIVSE